MSSWINWNVTHRNVHPDRRNTRAGARAEHPDLNAIARHSFGDDYWQATAASGRGFRSRACGGALENLYEAEAKFGEGVLNQPLFFQGQVALGLLLDHGQHVDRMTGRTQIGLFLLALFSTEGKKSHTHFGLCF